MNLHEFAKLVKEYRNVMESYFMTRDRRLISEAKSLASEIDIAVSEILEGSIWCTEPKSSKPTGE